MGSIDREQHWQSVYTTKSEQEVSWYQDSPEPSLELIALAGGTKESHIIDIGGGASRLVDTLTADGYCNVSVLDLSAAALATAKSRIGLDASNVKWIAADVTNWKPVKFYDIWHDRAAFHFLTAIDDQSKYVANLKSALRPGGSAIIGTFALDGPERCSGLVVARHDADSLKRVLGDNFKLIHTRRHEHVTPWKAVQKFQFSVFRFS